MIRYIEKGPGLFDAIEASGHFLYQKEGEWIASDAEAVQRIIDEYVEVVPAPEAVTARQARLALLAVGKLDMIEAALAQMPGPQGRAAQIEWEYALEIRRDSPLIAALAPALGLTMEQVDDLFRAAEGL